MATRWTCPRCKDAILGSERPRRDDVCRYCLPCSGKTGKLVARQALTLEKQRAEREARRSLRTQRSSLRARQQEASYFTVDGVDLRAIVEEAYRLPVAREWCARRGLPDRPPALTVRRARAFTVYRRGFAALSEHRIHVTVCVGPDGDQQPDVPIRTLLHEVAHVLVGSDRQHRYHGVKFQACLAALRREYDEQHPSTYDEQHPSTPKESSEESACEEGAIAASEGSEEDS